MNKRNPNWTRDELVLVLDFYRECNGTPPDQSSDEIGTLSQVLNKLNKTSGVVGSATFRNRNGVYMKLMNFRAFDKKFAGAGLARGGKLDQVVWNEFEGKTAELSRTAIQIKQILDFGESTEVPDVDQEEDDYAASEGDLVVKLHKSRERNANIVKKKKLSVLKREGELCCEACGFNFKTVYGDRGDQFIECHHELPVSELEPGQKTKLSELRLVCSNCHRMIHRRKPMLTIEDLRRTLTKKAERK